MGDANIVESERKLEIESEETGVTKEIFPHVMNNKWEEVIEKYSAETKYRTTRLTRSILKDTILHVAVLQAEPWVAEEMVKKIPPDEIEKILYLVNERGDTPLHLAASRGNAPLCRQMLNAVPILINIRNKNNETPLFVSVLYSNIEAYRSLRPWKTTEEARKHPHLCRRNNDGNNILHSAIDGEHFRLAWEIIVELPDLIKNRNEDGYTPLHILATKPNAFTSGKRHGPFDAILYQSISVDENKLTRNVDKAKKKKKKTMKYPENYTCVNIIKPIWKQIKFCANKMGISTKICGLTDEEAGDGQQIIRCQEEEMTEEEEMPDKELMIEEEEEEIGYLRPNWTTFSPFIGVLVKSFVIVLRIIGFQKLKKMKEKKEKHAWAVLIMKKLTSDPSAYIYSGLEHAPDSSYDTALVDGDLTSRPGSSPPTLSDMPFQPPGLRNSNVAFAQLCDTLTEKIKKELKVSLKKTKSNEEGEDENHLDQGKDMTPLLIAAKNGVSEIVQEILDKYPEAIDEVDETGKNVLLLAVEHRQTHVFEFLKRESKFKDDVRVFGHTDNQKNTAWHLAAMSSERRPWLIAGEAMQMEWEYKWFKYVKKSMPKKFGLHNDKGKTPKQIFMEANEELVKSGTKWLSKTSESCSVVAALIAGVAFATSVTVPGGNDEHTGKPVLEGQTAFNIFSISSLVSLCFSLTALVFFLAILTSRSEEKDFHKSVPRKLLFGMTSLFISIASMLMTFCAGHFFQINDRFAHAAFLIYFVTCLPLTFFAFSQLRLYFDLVYAIFTKVPVRSYSVLHR